MKNKEKTFWAVLHFPKNSVLKYILKILFTTIKFADYKYHPKIQQDKLISAQSIW